MVTAKAMVYFYGKDDVIFPLQGVQNPTSQQIRSLCPSGIKDPQKRKSHQASNMACLLILSCLALKIFSFVLGLNLRLISFIDVLFSQSRWSLKKMNFIFWSALGFIY